MTDLSIPISIPGKIFQIDNSAPVHGGGTRLVPFVPVGDDGSTLPCIWKSHTIIQATLSDGNHVPAFECLLLISRCPATVVRAEVPIDSWQHFRNGPVEW